MRRVASRGWRPWRGDRELEAGNWARGGAKREEGVDSCPDLFRDARRGRSTSARRASSEVAVLAGGEVGSARGSRSGRSALPSPRSAAKRLFFPLALELAALRGGDARRLRPFGRLRCFPAAPGNREGPVGRRAPELSWGAEPGVASGGVFRFGPVLHRRSVSPSFRGLDRGGGGFFAKGRVEATSGIFARPCLCGLVGTAREARRRGLVVPLCAVLRRRLLRPTRAARGGPLAARHWRGRRWGPEAGGLAWRWACVGPWQQLAPSLRAGPGPEDVSPKNLPPLFCRLRGLVYPFPGRAWRFPCAPVPRPLLTRFPPPLPFPLRLFPCVGV